MATAKKLPSGSWRVRVYDKETGKYISFTSELKGKAGKNEAEFMAKEWQTNRQKNHQKNSKKTVYTCVEEYIQSKENLLSPSSVRGYYIILRNSLGEFGNKKIDTLTEKDIQFWVNENAVKYAPKSVKSQYGLVSAALRQNRINLDFNSIMLPRLPKKEKRIPNEQEISKILHIIEGTSVELPITIAVTLGLRQSEIAALKWSDYNGVTLKIHAAKVPDKNNQYIIKNTTKSEASTREIEVGTLLKQRLDRAERKSDYISPMLPSSVLKKFNHLCDENGLPRFTMHAQRHGNASMMLAKGVPDKYAMKRLGQSSPNMIKDVYQHLYESKEKEVAQTVSDAFSEIYDTKYDTNNNK
ncbi:MAG: site-specific integrase [Ruminococcus flavefaciens]|nr:site-specific integrase [Ruminococcus flavefaciens]MCM1231092.1 site-specific integrase [Ruminococcus flavefaciens]